MIPAFPIQTVEEPRLGAMKENWCCVYVCAVIEISVPETEWSFVYLYRLGRLPTCRRWCQQQRRRCRPPLLLLLLPLRPKSTQWILLSRYLIAPLCRLQPLCNIFDWVWLRKPAGFFVCLLVTALWLGFDRIMTSCTITVVPHAGMPWCVDGT